MTVLLEALAIVVVLLAMLAAASIRVLREYERAVVFRLGRLVGVRGPGVILLIPAVDRMVRTSLRTVTLNVPPQDVITRDNVPARVDAVVYFRIVDAAASVVRIEDAHKATSQIAQTTLRSVLGKAELDALLSERESLNEDLQQIIDEQTEPWGIKVTTVEIKDVGIPSPMQRAMARQAQAERESLNEDLQQIIDEQTEPWGIKVTTVEIKDVGIPSPMQRAMARQAQAERERRAKVINAEGELQAAAKLSEAAGVLSVNPASIQLRYLQTLSELGGEQSSTIVFPLPIDVLSMLRPPAAAPAAPAAPAAEEPARLAAGEANGALAPGEEARERVSS
jgi:regulator of protease activity HflC (stomatin/prohibitin superfamily)